MGDGKNQVCIGWMVDGGDGDGDGYVVVCIRYGVGVHTMCGKTCICIYSTTVVE